MQVAGQGYPYDMYDEMYYD